MSTYTLFNAIGNGAQSNPGLTAAQLAYLASQFDLSQNIRTQLRTDARFSAPYSRVATRIERSIADWRRRYNYSASDTGVYYDVNNLPYRKNGDILVVVSDYFRRYNEAGVPIGAPVPTKTPYFDLRFNRIVVPTAALERMRLGEIQLLRNGGNINVDSDWQNLTLADTLIHEPGHRSDSSSTNPSYSTRDSWANLITDNDAERLQMMGRLVQGLPDTVPHGNAANSSGTRLPGIRYKDANGNWVLVRTPADVNRMWGSVTSEPEKRVLTGLDGNFYVVDDLNGVTVKVSPGGGVLGRMAGSSVGNYLTRNDGTLAQIATSTVLGSMGQALGNVVAINGAGADLSKSFDAAFANFDQTLYNNLKVASIGALTAYTTMELGRAIGLTGFGAELFNAAAGSAVSPIYDKVIGNIFGGRQVFDGFNLNDVFGGTQGLGDLVGAGIASFFGAKLGSLVISPTTSAGAALASLGSAAGAYALSSAGSAAIGGLAAKVFGQLGQFANIIGPGIGAFVGFVLGALVGSLFGRKKPRVPTASAEVALNFGVGEYQLGAVTVSNKGNRELATDMAGFAENTLNGIIEQLAGGRAWKNVNTVSPTQVYGHYGNQIRARFMGGAWQNFDSADKAVDWGILSAIRQTRVGGGNIFQKRALSNSPAASVSSLLGDLQVGYDYEFYMRNRTTINSMIRDNPTSEFAAAWTVTLGRANELGLNRFQRSDFFGGLAGFVDSITLRETAMAASYETISWYNDDYWELQSSDGAFAYPSDGGPWSISFRGSVFSDIGYNEMWPMSPDSTNGNDFAGWSKMGNTHPYGFNLDAYGGDDIIIGGYQPDVVYGSGGYDWLDGEYGNDVLDGGSEDDVLLGGANNDRLVGGSGNDYLASGDSDDYFFDANRTWGTYGGDGNDVHVGGGGLDSNYGENGDDTFIVDQDGGGVWDVHEGQAGLDTLSFERFTIGVYADFRNLGGWSWNPTAKYIYGDLVANIENLTGSQFGDHLSGDDSNNVIRGLGGNDTLLGQGGDDVLEGGRGADYLGGGLGTDTASYEHSSSAVVVNLGTDAALGGDASGDSFSEIENLRGSKLNDQLTGSAGNNVLAGLAGDDTLGWSAGYDVLDGGEGFDIFDASAATSALTVYSNGYAYAGGATSVLTGVEGFIGTGGEDNISGTAADEMFDGRAFNDVISGGSGADTYIYGSGYHWDTIHETVDGYNVISLNAGLDWRNVWIKGWGLNTDMTVDILPTGEWVRVVSNYQFTEDQTANYNKIKTVNIAGLSSVDVGEMLWGIGGQTTGGDVLRGASNAGDIIFDFGGDDIIYASYNATNYEQFGNLVYAGDGNDSVYASAGDDQYIFEYGNGRDTIYDTGGADTVVMGPSVRAEDVIYEVRVTGSDGYGGEVADLYIGLRDPNNLTLKASEVADNIRIVNGGTKFIDVYYGTEQFNTIEHVRVAGQEIDLTKADIAWRTSYTYNYGGGTHLYPVAIDLDGDGIELRSVEGSRISTVDADGALWRLGWLGKDDGFLALDRNSDGVIDRLSEISFVDDLEGAKTDLEGLAAYDSNNDGTFDGSDARWAEFRIWQDKNQDGIGSKKELISLNEAGIVSISLKGQATGFTEKDGIDNSILATTTIGWVDPARVGKGYDVALAIHHVRSDEGGRAIADDHAKAKGKNKADDFEAKLYGIQALTEAEITAGKAKGKRDTSADSGLLGRVETFLPSAGKGADGKVKLTEADDVHRKNRQDADEAEKDAKKDKFAKDDWTRDGSAGKPILLDAVKDDQRKPSADLNAEEKVKFDKAIAHFEEEKKREAKDDDDRVTRDAALPKNPAPTPLPSDAELADLKARDSFRLLTNDTDAETQKKLDEEKARKEKSEVAEMQSLAEPALSGWVPSGTASNQSSSAEMSKSASEEELYPRWSEGGQPESARDNLPADPRSAVDGAVADELGYDVRIQVANARLVQALASFDDAPAMMAQYRGLNFGDGDVLPGWLTVNHQPSIQGFAALR